MVDTLFLAQHSKVEKSTPNGLCNTICMATKDNKIFHSEALKYRKNWDVWMEVYHLATLAPRPVHSKLIVESFETGCRRLEPMSGGEKADFTFRNLSIETWPVVAEHPLS
jgi:hypothetical protein